MPMPEPTVSPQAKLAAKEVLRNLNDRRGIRQALDECDAGIIKELTETIAAIIEKEMAKK